MKLAFVPWTQVAVRTVALQVTNNFAVTRIHQQTMRQMTLRLKRTVPVTCVFCVVLQMVLLGIQLITTVLMRTVRMATTKRMIMMMTKQFSLTVYLWQFLLKVTCERPRRSETKLTSSRHRLMRCFSFISVFSAQILRFDMLCDSAANNVAAVRGVPPCWSAQHVQHA